MANRNILEIGWERVTSVLGPMADDAFIWLGDREPGERLILATFFILLLLFLIIRMSTRREDSTGRNFGSSLLLIVVFAFGLGWILDGDSAFLSSVFNI